MKHKFLCGFIVMMMCGGLLGTTVFASSDKNFSFYFNDYNNHDYASTWSKGTWNGYYTITLSRNYGNGSSTMSSANIFGCKLKDQSIAATVDSYHTFSNYVTNYGINYKAAARYGDTMQFTGKKDSSSISSAALKIAGSVTP